MKIYHTVADGSYHTATHAFSGRPKVNGEQVKCTNNQFRTQATLFLMGLMLGVFLNVLVVLRDFVCRVCGLEVEGCSDHAKRVKRGCFGVLESSAII